MSGTNEPADYPNGHRRHRTDWEFVFGVLLLVVWTACLIIALIAGASGPTTDTQPDTTVDQQR